MPFGIGPTARYILSFLVAVFSALFFKKYYAHPDKEVARMKSLLVNPIFLGLMLWNLFAVVSIYFSPEPDYSLRVYLSEFFINSSLFATLSLALATSKNCPLKWENILFGTNLVFLASYLGIMGAWLLFPHNLFWGDQELINRFIADRMDIVFEFGRTCKLFQGIHHTSIFLGLMIAFWSISPFKKPSVNFIFLFVNFLVLFTTTRRGAIIACLLGLFLSYKLTARKIATLPAIAILFVVIAILGTVIGSGAGKHFVREDWHLISKGKIEEARHLGGSIPLRITTYREFIKEIAQHPFLPRGLGKKFIKEYWQQLVQKAGLQHGHNTFINQAFYMGIQGALALMAIIVSQWRLFWAALIKQKGKNEERLFIVALVFLLIYWTTNMFTDVFRHDSASLYWFFTAVATGRALQVTVNPDTQHPAQP